jgi:pimeloyl-ACP methyl ester carboxylesterase
MIARSAMLTPSKLAADEEHFHIQSHHDGLMLFLRYLPPTGQVAARERVVLYVHGGTFPSALSIAHRFDGRSWRDELCAAGFHVWGVDFHGFGRFSDAYPEMEEPAASHSPLGRAEDASRQIEQAVRFICSHHSVAQISIVAHSWGTIASGRFAARRPELVDRMVFFGPIARRPRRTEPVRLPAWRLISLQDQWERFTADVPPGEPPVLLRRHFEGWGEAYLDVDPESRSRSPESVKTPSGAFQDIFDAWGDELAYDPALIRVPVAIIRGEWDSMCTDEDAKWLFDSLTASPLRQDIKISRATHLMHLEENRGALYREANTFLHVADARPMPQPSDVRY